MEFYSKVSPTFSIPLQSEGVSRSDGVVLSEGVSRSDGVVDQKRYLIPLPTLCPECRKQRRLAFRNERKLYKRKCDATGKDAISVYSPEAPYTVYHQDYWWSDAWDALSYGREYETSTSAMGQFGALLQVVPKMALVI